MKKPKIRFQKSMLKTFLHSSDGSRIIARDWDVFQDGIFMGTIDHVFAKPSEFHGIFGRRTERKNLKSRAMRRGWKFCFLLADRLDIRLGGPDRRCFYLFPLLEAKALVRHCLTNKVGLDGMTGRRDRRSCQTLPPDGEARMKRPGITEIRFRKSAVQTGRESRRDWDVIEDGKFVGCICHIFLKPSEYHEVFGKKHPKPRNMRRGWWLSPRLENRVGITVRHPAYNAREYHKRLKPQHYCTFPLMEAKALVKHCLQNKVSLDGMDGNAIMDLAKHCRKMELIR